MTLTTTLALITLPLLTYLLLWPLYTLTLHPLHHIPGPRLATLTRLHLLHRFLKGDIHKSEQNLHAKHGPLVRIAPDELTCSDPDAIKKIYRFQHALPKTDFYLPFASGRSQFSRHLDLFAELGERKHGERRRIVNHLYTLGNVLRLEGFVDECSEVFVRRMGELADEGADVDLGEWLQWYTFDVIGQLFFGRMFGFMEKGMDVGGWIQALDRLFPFIVTMSIVPSYLRWLVGLSALFSGAARKGLEAMDRIVDATKETVARRVTVKVEDVEDGVVRSDLLQQMLGIVRDKGEKVDFGVGDIQVEAHVALFAGSDTTAILMRAVVYYLMKNLDVYHEVQEEIDRAAADGQLSPVVKYAEAIKLPLFCATVKEAMRLHPSVGMSLPRMVPAGGIELAGTYVPQGYRIGVNPAIIQCDQSVFGPDADLFRPARWLEGNTAVMDRHILAFGTGTRTCIGKHIALVEVHKLLPHLLRDFDLKLVDPEKAWTTYNMFINKQTDIRARIKRRSMNVRS